MNFKTPPTLNPNDPDHEKKRAKLHKIGLTLLIIGIVFDVAFFVFFFINFMDFDTTYPIFMFLPFPCAFIGFPLTGIGSTLLKAAHLGTIQNYVANETGPTSVAAANYVMDGTRDGLAETISAVKKAMDDQKGVECVYCHAKNDKDAKYCDNCGKPITHQNVCPTCGSLNDEDAKYCSACGRKL